MNKNLYRHKYALIFSILLTLCLSAPALSLTDDAIATVVLEPAGVTWQPRVEYSSLVLTVSAPNGEVFRQEFGAGANPSFSIFNRKGGKWPDGQYTYELRLAPVISAETRAALAASRESGNSKATVRDLQAAGQLPSREVVQTGSFLVVQGAIFTSTSPEGTNPKSSSAQTESQTSITTEVPINDQVIPDDLIVQGAGCFGFDCVNNESFGFDTMRLKENNTRLTFMDTSASAGYSTRDWRLRANESGSGGMNAFFIDDMGDNSNGSEGVSSTPFTLAAGAPTNSIFLASTGKLGLRTATPGLDIHMATGDTPAVRFEQTNGGGFTAQTWDIGANEANFFVRDQTGGSHLSFRIRPGAPTSSIDISASGNVGIGTASPGAKLDIATAPDLGLTSGLRLTDIATTPNAPYAIANLYNSTGAGRFGLFTQTAQTAQIAAAGVSYFNGGNVGIGTSSPNFKLDVAGIVNASAFYLNGVPFNQGATVNGTSTTNKLAKWSNGAAAQLADSVVTEVGGNVGIGTNSPSYKLVVGPDLGSGFSAATATISKGPGQSVGILIGPSAAQAVELGWDNASSRAFINAPATNPIAFMQDGNERMRISSVGNLGIGTTTPQSTLQVNGYVQLALTSGAPPAADCDAASEYGRMKVDATGNKLYICTSTGWKSTALVP